MLNNILNVYKNIKYSYEKTCLKILDYLDTELKYENSLKYYTDQQQIKTLTMEYESCKMEEELYSLSSLPENAIEEIIRINKKITDHTWGVILESKKVSDINVYIAQMNKIQINARKANFFVITDSEEILLKLHNTFNWMNKIFYIIPNTYDTSIDAKYRPSIKFHCLKHLEKHVSTPGSKYMSILKDVGGKQVTVPNENRVFCFNSKRLVPGS